MKLRVISFGRDRSGLFEPAIQEYRARLSHYVRIELVQLAEARGKNLTPELARQTEGRAIAETLSARDRLWALDQRGEECSSEQLAKYLGQVQQSARDLAIVIGGDEGLGSEVTDRADKILALSRLTLPHRMARLLLVEQLYRSFSILRGEPYHK